MAESWLLLLLALGCPALPTGEQTPAPFSVPLYWAQAHALTLGIPGVGGMQGGRTEIFGVP